jgi:hypothetical protein
MMRFFFLTLMMASQAMAYVPTVESLFRHGSNPDISSNGLSLTLIVKKMDQQSKKPTEDDSTIEEKRQEDFYRIFFTQTSSGLKVAQARYRNGTFSDSALEHKIYYPNFTPFTVKPDVEFIEKGLFYGLLNSMALNNGAHIVNYLKGLGVPVKLNSEIINREKITYLVAYKQYLVAINRDRAARKTETNPLRPEDAVSRERVEKVMKEPMYVNTQQVKLFRDEGEIVWQVAAGNFEATASYNHRDIQKIKYQTPAGEYLISCRDYWLLNGTHSMPRYIMIKTLKGESYQVEITNMRHYPEKEEDLVRRLKKWDEVLRGKESTDARPEFLL